MSHASTWKDAPFPYLNAQQSQELDDMLMSPQGGHSLFALMELAGVSVAQVAYTLITQQLSSDRQNKEKKQLIASTSSSLSSSSSSSLSSTEYSTPVKVCILVGPGNNGGDGLVAARHLRQLLESTHHTEQDTQQQQSIHIHLCYPKATHRTTLKPIFQALLTAAENEQVQIYTQLQEMDPLSSYSLIIDALFGFSFQANSLNDIRTPYDVIIAELTKVQDQVHILAVDVPSGWNVDKGDILGLKYMPSSVISLSVPKQCMLSFTGRHHFLGGRFIPAYIFNHFQLSQHPQFKQTFAYQGVNMFVDITHTIELAIARAAKANA